MHGDDGILDLPPELAERYVDLHLLGAGGMGEVHRAWDRRLEREVALKSVRTEHRSSTDFDTRLKREARALARIAHPNVVRVFDVHLTPRCCLYAMEFVEGRPLSQILRREGAFEATRALVIARDLADALATAHDVDVVHRDVKAENVLMAGGDVPMLVDFGLVRFDATEMTALTRTGEFVGTLYALPPEVFAGRTPDGAGDVYQLGLVLHEMMTGKHLHGDSLPQDLLSGKAAAAARRRLQALETECPRAPAALLRRCLAEDPAARPTAAALRDALTALLDGTPDTAGPGQESSERRSGCLPTIEDDEGARTRPGRRLLVAGGALLLVLLAVLFGISRTGVKTSPPPGPRLRVQAKGAEAVWTTVRSRRFTWRLLTGERVLLRGGENAPSCIHSIRLSSLAPGRDYVLVLLEGERSWSHPFRTPLPSFDGSLWTFAEKGRFYLRCDPPPRTRLDLTVNDGHGERRRHVEAGERSLLIHDLAPDAAEIRWTVEVAGVPFTRGRTPGSFRWTHLPGKELDPDTGKHLPAALQDGPLWDGRRIYASARSGHVSAYALDGRRGDEGSGHGLRLLWTCQPMRQNILMPLVSVARCPNWLTLLPEKLLFCSTLSSDGRLQVQSFQVEVREGAWAAKTKTTTTPFVDGIPQWATVGYGEWDGPIDGREMERKLPFFGFPGRSSLLHEGRIYASFHRMHSPDSSGGGHGFVRLDPRTGKVALLGSWPTTGDTRWPAETSIDTPPVVAHGKLYALVRLGKPEMRRHVKVYGMLLLALPLDGAGKGVPKILERVEAPSGYASITASETSGRLYVCTISHLLEIDPRGDGLRRIPYTGPDEAIWSRVSARGPLLLGGRELFVVIPQARRSVSTSVMGLQESFGYLAFLETDRLVARGPRLCTEVDDSRLSEQVYLGRWSGGFFALTRQNAITFELEKRRFSTAPRLHCNRAALDGEDLVALRGPGGELAVLPLLAQNAQMEGRIPWPRDEGSSP